VISFLSRRLQFNTLLRQSQSGLDTSQYIRLVCLGSLDLLVGLPLNIYFLVNQTRSLLPWLGWDEVHYGWHQILHISGAVMMRNDEIIVHRMLTKYTCPLLALIFFVFFGVSDDAISEYSRYLNTVRRALGVRENKAADK
jgi:pheromone a factor receptor